MKRVLGFSMVGFVLLLTTLVGQAQQIPTTEQSVSTATIGGGGTANHIPIWTNATTLGNSVVFQKNGNIGIGTTNPAANEKLEVNGGVRVDGSVAVTGSLVAQQTLLAGSNLEVLDALFVQGNIPDSCSGFTSANLIGNFPTNSVGKDVTGATIGGGGTPGRGNRVTDIFGTVSGGLGNVAGNDSGTSCDAVYATVGGGQYNFARDAYATVAGGGGNTASSNSSTVAGGASNTASGNSSTVAGGNSNTASGEDSTVAGGMGNTASGFTSTVPGGNNNTASGDNSFAAGVLANAKDSGSFLWCQTNGIVCNSLGTNSFQVAVLGPIFFFDGPNGAGCNLSAGGGSWNCSSDRNLKDDVTPIDSRLLLERVAQMPITQWKMKGEPVGRKHIGPMAQDFYAAFGLGDDDRYIALGDGQGVALAAIQALYKVVQEKDQQIQQLQQRLERLERVAQK